MTGEFGAEGIHVHVYVNVTVYEYVYIWLSPFAIHLKL